jgi:hypothetical protein
MSDRQQLHTVQRSRDIAIYGSLMENISQYISAIARANAIHSGACFQW